MTLQAFANTVDVRAVTEPSIIALFSVGLPGMGIGLSQST